jgi:hypothetical protein
MAEKCGGTLRGVDAMTRPIAALGFLFAGALVAWGGQAGAQQSDSPLKSAAKILDFATDVAPPADFVVQSRPKSDPDFIPVFQPPPEPARPPLSAKDLTSLKGDLDSVQKRHDSVRQGFAPAAKAVAEQQAAKKQSGKAPANQ